MDVDKDSSIKKIDDGKHQKPTDRIVIAEKAERAKQLTKFSKPQIEGHPREDEIFEVMEVDDVNAGLDDNLVFEEDHRLQKPIDDTLDANLSQRIAVERFKTDERSGHPQEDSRKEGEPEISPRQSFAQNDKEEEQVANSRKPRNLPSKPTPQAVKSLDMEIPKVHRKVKGSTKADQRLDAEQAVLPRWPEATQARTVVQGPVTENKQARDPQIGQEERIRTNPSLWLPKGSGAAIPFANQTATLANGNNITIEEAGRSFSETLVPLLKGAFADLRRRNGESDADDGGISGCKRKRDPKGDVPHVNRGERPEQRHDEGGIKEQIVDIGTELMKVSSAATLSISLASLTSRSI